MTYQRSDDGGCVHSQPAISPHARLAAMDREGIDIAVPFPTLGLYTIDARDPELNAAVCRPYNDWLHEEYVCWASDYPQWDAIFPGALAELRQHMKGLSEAAQRKILGENARRFLSLPSQ